MMTNEEVHKTVAQLKQILATPENAMKVLSELKTPVNAEHMTRIVLALATGALLADEKELFSAPKAAEAMLAAVEGLNRPPSIGAASVETLIDKLQNIVDALRAATAAVKN